ncbi:hypothetical protein EU538_00630 [Candidatus Thorarchaeota archaeon]|nr:MAG: hypothetical protein EU538_00630 [Candidatus Thorarchaeota archaeon]
MSYRNHSDELVPAEPGHVDTVTRRRLYGALAFMIILLLGLYALPRMDLFPQTDPTYEPSHYITLSAEPANLTYKIELSFYLTEGEARAETNRLGSTTLEVDPNVTGGIESPAYGLPTEPEMFWIRVGLGRQVDEQWTWRYEVYALIVGTERPFNLQGHVFCLLVTRA